VIVNDMKINTVDQANRLTFIFTSSIYL